MSRIILPAAAFLLLTACDKPTLFRELKAEQTGIAFSNAIREDGMINMLTYEYLYNGGGVGIADFNNDGKPDIYLTASMGPNALYLNEGGMRFRDVTAAAGVDGKGRWSRGVAVVDINNDGLQDIYVCAGTWQVADQRRNLLYLNMGADPANGVPRFAEMAADYGIDDTTNTQMAAFFDYDRDGDLDMYLLVNQLGREKPNTFRPIKTDGSAANTDRLYRNDWDPVRQHAYYTDVSKQAGITWEGFGLGVQVLDIDDDGWKDILVSNDYLTGDILYVNNRNGTFTNRVNEYFRKGSLNAMGNDAADIDNDGLVDIIETDMAAEDNMRFKMMMNPIDYNWYRYTQQYGFQYQTVRNTLQLNRGRRPLPNDSLGAPAFSETAFLSGVAYTDWSWAPLLADLDQDGYRDLMVTNGLPKDITDNDYIAYRESKGNATPKELLLLQPPVTTSNYVFKNNGDLTFSDKTREWGWDVPSFSNGMAYADLDGDGDLDVVVNNINMPATVWENRTESMSPESSRHIRIGIRGDTSNINGFGTVVRIWHQGTHQAAELTPYRGYMSSVEPVIHFGLGRSQKIDSMVVDWPDGSTETLRDIPAGQTLLLSQSASALPRRPKMDRMSATLLRDVAAQAGIFYSHSQADFPDFDIQRALPHKFSALAAPIAVGDLNGDGLEDMVVGGNTSQKAFLYFQDAGGRFTAKYFNSDDSPQAHEDAAAALLDADVDGDLDIYLSGGGARFKPGSPQYADRLWLNDGKGRFTEAPQGSIPNLLESESTVKTADFDGDGKTDILLTGKVIPGRYPGPASCRLFHNESGNGRILFRDVTAEIAGDLVDIGLVSDAAWADFDGDKDLDLALTGEWMGVEVFRNDKGSFARMTTGMQDHKGWWNSLSTADLDGDGDLDIVAGNQGLNGYFRATEKEPLRAYSKDYDGNGRTDLLLSQYRCVTPHGARKEYPVAMRDALAEELPQIKKSFPRYDAYGKASVDEVLKGFDRKGERVLEAGELASGWWENQGNMRFTFHPFPTVAQFAPIHAIAVTDLDGNGIPDLILGGNDGTMSPIPGRSDASYGTVLLGQGKGVFTPVSLQKSGWFETGDVRHMPPIRLADGSRVFVVSKLEGAVGLMRSSAGR
jgi:hypothetical protein